MQFLLLEASAIAHGGIYGDAAAIWSSPALAQFVRETFHVGVRPTGLPLDQVLGVLMHQICIAPPAQQTAWYWSFAWAVQAAPEPLPEMALPLILSHSQLVMNQHLAKNMQLLVLNMLQAVISRTHTTILRRYSDIIQQVFGFFRFHVACTHCFHALTASEAKHCVPRAGKFKDHAAHCCQVD